MILTGSRATVAPILSNTASILLSTLVTTRLTKNEATFCECGFRDSLRIQAEAAILAKKA